MHRRVLGCSMLFLVAAAACGNDPRPAAAVDCAVPANVEFAPVIRDFENPNEAVPWFASGDTSGARDPVPPSMCGDGGLPDGGTGDAGVDGVVAPFDASTTPATEAVARVPIDGGRCGSQGALVLTSSGHNDWGTLFADYAMISPVRAGTGWDGISFWARTGTLSDRAVTLAIDTPQTTIEGLRCKEYCNDQQNQTFTDPNTGQVVTEGDVDPPDACGNQFTRKLVTSERWELYLLPFETFQQEPQPSASPDGMDTSAIMRFAVRSDKGATLELWLDDIRFYRRN